MRQLLDSRRLLVVELVHGGNLTCGHGCVYVGPPTPELKDTPERIELALEAQRDWLEHTVRSCKLGAGVRRLCHDAILNAIADMMVSTGFEDVEKEDRWWDPGDEEEENTRRPDITAFNPRDRKRYVIDVVGAWSFVDGGGRGAWREPGSGANAKAGFKWRSYKGALKRQEDGGIGWLAASKSRPQDEFVPFAFEVGGALGDEAEGFLRECAAVADHCRREVGDLMHWSAMTWGGH